MKPFNFFLTFQGKRLRDLQVEDPDRAWKPRDHEPKPTAPYRKASQDALPHVFDRDNGEPISSEVLRNYAEALRQYHLHPETKFLCGRPMDCGPTKRRHIFVASIEAIGKEANEIEEDETFGVDDESVLIYGISADEKTKMVAAIAAAPKRKLARLARMSDHTIDKVRLEEISDDVLRRLYEAALKIEQATLGEALQRDEIIAWLNAERDKIGIAALAARLEYNGSNLRKILLGDRKLPKPLVERVRELLDAI